jgi:hypothetical protein
VSEPDSPKAVQPEPSAGSDAGDPSRVATRGGEQTLATRQKPPRLSEEIAGLIALLDERSVRLREVLAVLQARAYTLLVLLLALPFCTPLPLVGVSTPFGTVIAIIGFRLALGQKPWLPQRLLDTTLPSGFFTRLLGAAKWLVYALEALLRPRLSGLVENRLFRHAYGVIIFICGFVLLLPLPIPLTNGLPALTIVLFAGAMLERDGVSMIAGLLSFALTLCLLALLAWGGAEAVEWLTKWLGGFGASDHVPETPIQ